jgi:hypothetical protein
LIKEIVHNIRRKENRRHKEDFKRHKTHASSINMMSIEQISIPDLFADAYKVIFLLTLKTNKATSSIKNILSSF